MSPRRKVDPVDRAYFTAPTIERVRWGLPVTAIAVAILVAATIAASIFMTARHISDDRTQERDTAALTSVRDFMTTYTSLDPFHANDYADGILAHATGDFAKQFKDRMNEIVIRIARLEPTTGSVAEAGVQRWNQNGSADILVATTSRQKSPDGKSTMESGDRWVVTTIEEGQQWKISQLIQVI